jgi:hypothetical protein
MFGVIEMKNVVRLSLTPRLAREAADAQRPFGNRRPLFSLDAYLLKVCPMRRRS